MTASRTSVAITCASRPSTVSTRSSTSSPLWLSLRTEEGSRAFRRCPCLVDAGGLPAGRSLGARSLQDDPATASRPLARGSPRARPRRARPRPPSPPPRSGAAGVGGCAARRPSRRRSHRRRRRATSSTPALRPPRGRAGARARVTRSTSASTTGSLRAAAREHGAPDGSTGTDRSVPASRGGTRSPAASSSTPARTRMTTPRAQSSWLSTRRHTSSRVPFNGWA